MTLFLRQNNTVYSFNVTYENSNGFFSNSSKCNFGLVGAFDTINKYGGYKNEDEKVSSLVILFDNTFISKIKGDK